jgi:hypothetical protein
MTCVSTRHRSVGTNPLACCPSDLTAKLQSLGQSACNGLPLCPRQVQASSSVDVIKYEISCMRTCSWMPSTQHQVQHRCILAINILCVAAALVAMHSIINGTQMHVVMHFCSMWMLPPSWLRVLCTCILTLGDKHFDLTVSNVCIIAAGHWVSTSYACCATDVLMV